MHIHGGVVVEMSGGYRLILAAALGLAAFVILGTGAYVGALYGARYSQAAAELASPSTNPKHRNPSQIDRDRAGLPNWAERVASGPDPKSTDEREKRDLAAQESNSVWTFWMLIASSIGVVVTMVGTGFLLWQVALTRQAVKDTGEATEVMRESNRIADLALGQAKLMSEMQARAYVALEVVTFSVLADNGATVRYGARATFVNAGQTPALDTTMDVALAFCGSDVSEEEMDEKLTKYDETPSAGKGHLGAGRISECAFFDDISVEQMALLTSGVMRCIAYGWFKYSDVFGKTHETHFRWRTDAETAARGFNATRCGSGNWAT